MAEVVMDGERVQTLVRVVRLLPAGRPAGLRSNRGRGSGSAWQLVALGLDGAVAETEDLLPSPEARQVTASHPVKYQHSRWPRCPWQAAPRLLVQVSIQGHLDEC